MSKFPFADDEVVIARDGFVGALDDGTEIVVEHGRRIRSSDPVVRKWPALFVRDGEVPVPEDRPYPEEPEPVKKPVKRYRVREDYHGRTLLPDNSLAEVHLRKGDEVTDALTWWRFFSPSLRRRVFKEIKG